MNNINMADLRVIFVLYFKNEMIEKGIIPENVDWTKLTDEQRENVKKFLEEKIEEAKNNDVGIS